MLGAKMLKFDRETAKILDVAYQGADIIRRRRASFDALNPSPGETILDIGCGNGLLTAELARAVGPSGRIVGVDPSKDMLAVGKNRCLDYSCVEFLEGVAGNLPLADEIADKAVSVQVFEYVEDIGAAFGEAMRCLKPAGRFVISDLHFGSLIWFSDEPERMQLVLSIWNEHFASGTVPERLPALIRESGHSVEDVVSITMTDHQLKPDGIAIMMMHLMKQFVVNSAKIESAVAQAWFDEQVRLAEQGRFFFSVSQFVVVARKSS